LRLREWVLQENIWVVCGSPYAQAIPRHIPEILTDHIIVEPQAKNTAPALALAAFHLEAKDPEAVMIVLPADHLVLRSDWDLFISDLKMAAQIAVEDKALVTLGIVPNLPETGFGYLEQGKKMEDKNGVYYTVKAFHEKPDLKTAEKYLSSGKYFWNSGMFVWKVKVFLDELSNHQPEMYEAFEKLREFFDTPQYPKQLEEVFSSLDNISIDYALMEKASKVVMIPASFQWDDVGNLTAFSKVLDSDEENNFTQGEVFCVESQGNLVMAQDRPVALVGVKDLVVVEAPKGVIVLPKSKAQDVKKLIEYLKKNGREDLL